MNNRRSLVRLMLALIFPVVIMAVASGCQVVDKDRVRDDRTDTLPWNNRAGWEDTTLGVPY